MQKYSLNLRLFDIILLLSRSFYLLRDGFYGSWLKGRFDYADHYFAEKLYYESTEQLFKEFLFDVLDEKSDADKITLRFGVFTDAQREPDIDERFDRARIAADRVKDDSRSTIGFYDAN